MDMDSQEGLGTMEEETAAQSIRNESKAMQENEADKVEGEGELRTDADKEVLIL